MARSDETFLSRWSRRKLDTARQQAPDGEAAEPVTGTQEREGERSPGEADATAEVERPLTEQDFADVEWDKLDQHSSYERFLGQNVPPSIRGRALARMWTTDPVLASPDPFFEYAGDYTDKAVAGGLVQSAYKVGQGFLSDDEAAAWDRLGKPERPEPNAVLADAKDDQAKDGGRAAVDAATAPPQALVIAEETPEQPDVHSLLTQSDALMAALYPSASNHLLDVAALQAPAVRFLVARRQGAAIGCGALVPAEAGEAEIKRMFVAPEARGCKSGRALLAALEDLAKQMSVRVVRLETGISQPEALGLYRSHGYTERGPFGSYRPDPLSVFMEKVLA